MGNPHSDHHAEASSYDTDRHPSCCEIDGENRRYLRCWVSPRTVVAMNHVTSRRMPRLLAAVVAVVVVMGGCSGNSNVSSIPTSTEPTETTATGGGTDFDVTPTTPPPAEPIVDIPDYGTVPIGGTESETQELAQACSEAVAPIREVMAQYNSGLIIPDSARDIINDALSAADVACNDTDWADFQKLELQGWLFAAAE